MGKSNNGGTGKFPTVGDLTMADLDKLIGGGRLLSSFSFSTPPPPFYSNEDKRWYHAKGMLSIQERGGMRVFQVENTTQVERLEDVLNEYEDRLAASRMVIDEQREEMAKLKTMPTTLAVAFLERVKQL